MDCLRTCALVLRRRRVGRSPIGDTSGVRYGLEVVGRINVSPPDVGDAERIAPMKSAPGPRVRVLWLAKGLGQGGMERLLVTHAKFGDRDRFDYRAAYLVDRPHSVIDELLELGVPVEQLGSGNGNDPRWVADLVRLVRRERIDVVHAHSPMPAAIARVALTMATPKVRFVYTEHNRWDRYSRPTRGANRLTFRLNDAAYAVSDDCRMTVPRSLRPKVTTLIHGIDVDAVAAHAAHRDEARAELGIADGTTVVGTVANLRKQKNYPMLLDAAAKVCAERDDVLFLAVGQGPLEGELRARHAQLGLGDRFRFLGFRSDVHRIMSAFDIFCLSSDHEGLPVALMEAIALGLPVVSTAVGGVPDAVGAGDGAWLVPVGDLDALARTIVVAVDRRLADSPVMVASPRMFDARRSVALLEDCYGPKVTGSASRVSMRRSQ